MEIALNSDQMQFRDSIRKLLDDRAEAGVRRIQNAAERRSAWASFAELGLLGVAVPEALGGFAGSLEDIAVVAFELGREPVGSPRIEWIMLAARLLAANGGEQARALLDRFIAGDMRPAFAGYEQPDDFTLSCITTVAVTTPHGGYRISGRKLMVVDGDQADLLFVVARIAGEPIESVAVFAVDAATPGISVSAYELIDLTAAADIDFQDVLVPAEALLLHGSDARNRLEDVLDEAVVALCANSVGSIERSIELTVDFLKMREQFGRPLAQFQALQHGVADLFVAATDARSSVYAAIAGLREGGAVACRAVAGCKVKVSTVAKAVIGQAVHLHGGIGFTSEYPIGHHFRRAVVDEKLLGDSEFHLQRFLTQTDVLAMDVVPNVSDDLPTVIGAAMH